MRGVIGRKIGMTQIYDERGARVAVTVIDVGGNVVVQKKSAQDKDGYNAVKLAFCPADLQQKNGLVRYRGVNRPEWGVFKKVGIETPRRHVREFRVGAKELDRYEVGKELLVEEEFLKGTFVDVSGISKGRGFQGVIRRHGFHMPKMTHGTHENFRHGGSIGASADPARVFKGKKMPGQLGNAPTTVQNLKVVDVMADEGLVLLKGGVPGPNGGLVKLRQAVKKADAPK
jgi:large subunit ribosomal protein L3